jgi:hypothetical protein
MTEVFAAGFFYVFLSQSMAICTTGGYFFLSFLE